MKKIHFFELRVKFSDKNGMSCLLYEMPPQNGSWKRQNARLISKINEYYLNFAEGSVHAALKRNQYQSTLLSPRRKVPFKLKEEDGIRLDLIFKSIYNIKKRSRIEDIILGVNHMAREEAYYWHGLLLRDENNNNNNGLKALRILLGGK